MCAEYVTVENEVTKDKLKQDLRVVVADLEELMRATAGQANEKVAEVRERVQGHLDVVKDRLAQAEDAVMVKAKQAADATDDYVNENPWRAVGIAAGAGLLIGMLIGRGR
jgi:ElaB/YqjD/DUF883 family membrane-anchored ribosome-binding protein